MYEQSKAKADEAVAILQKQLREEQAAVDHAKEALSTAGSNLLAAQQSISLYKEVVSTTKAQMQALATSAEAALFEVERLKTVVIETEKEIELASDAIANRDYAISVYKHELESLSAEQASKVDPGTGPSPPKLTAALKQISDKSQ